MRFYRGKAIFYLHSYTRGKGDHNYSGEIIGFAGLIGAGRTELARAIFGAKQLDSEDIHLFGIKSNPFLHPHHAFSQGVAYLSEDSKVRD